MDISVSRRLLYFQVADEARNLLERIVMTLNAPTSKILAICEYPSTDEPGILPGGGLILQPPSRRDRPEGLNAHRQNA
jgi:hypothetical protein